MLERATYSIPEVAKILGIGRCTAYEAVRTGRIGALRIGKRIVVPRCIIERMLQEAGQGQEAAKA